jgi:dehydrodolichyl diphosphate syntase complex subunit NUS1
MLNSITFYIYTSLCNLVLFISNLIGFKALKNLLEVSFDRQKNNTLIAAPNHIGIAFVEEDLISYRHMFDLILHSTTYGVKRITFYDPWSRIKSDKSRFAKDLRKYLKHSSVIPIFNDDDTVKVVTNKRSIHISILGANDGRGALVNVCKKLCHLSREIKIEDIDEELQQQSIFEPDLLIKLGSIQSLAGYPPWSLRVTEIIDLPSLSTSTSNFTKSQFEEILINFSRRERRLGR